MDQRTRRARDIQRQIGDVLFRSWDPLGVRDEPAAANEYEAYVGGVYRLLASGASARDIAKHLADLETGLLGYPDTDPKMLIPLANKLLRLHIQLASDAGAT